MRADTPVINKDVVEFTKSKLPDETTIYAISDFFKIFGDSTRLQILCALEANQMCVGDLCNAIDITKSAASHQLNILKANKLVKYRKVGKNVVYSLDDDHVSMIIETAKRHLEEK